jgi:hypothetical protein
MFSRRFISLLAVSVLTASVFPQSGNKNLQTAAKPQPQALERLWSDLGSDDAAKAYRAIWGFVNASKEAVPFLDKHLAPAAPADPKRVAGLIRDLDDDRIAVRKKATVELGSYGELAEAPLRKALDGKPSLEVRRRLEYLLQRIEQQIVGGESLRAVRAVEALEQMGTAEARRLLEKLARGTPEARLTQEAKASLVRLVR